MLPHRLALSTADKAVHAATNESSGNTSSGETKGQESTRVGKILVGRAGMRSLNERAGDREESVGLDGHDEGVAEAEFCLTGIHSPIGDET